MADNLRDVLAEIHTELADQLLEDLRAEPLDPDDPESVMAARQRRAQARRDALQLLRQNGITAPDVENTPINRIRDKLDFSAVSQKIIPLRERATGG